MKKGRSNPKKAGVKGKFREITPMAVWLPYKLREVNPDQIWEADSWGVCRPFEVMIGFFSFESRWRSASMCVAVDIENLIAFWGYKALQAWFWIFLTTEIFEVMWPLQKLNFTAGLSCIHLLGISEAVLWFLFMNNPSRRLKCDCNAAQPLQVRPSINFPWRHPLTTPFMAWHAHGSLFSSSRCIFRSWSITFISPGNFYY